MTRLGIAVVAMVAGLSAAAGPLAAQSRRYERVYVTVADAQGRPVTGLGADDFFLELDGTRQEVISVEPASEPLSVVVLTDRLGLNSDFRASDLQRALQRYADTVRAGAPDSRIALTTFDGIVVRVVRFDGAAATLDRELGRLTVVSRDAPFVDALGDACSMMEGAPTGRRAILIVFAAYRPDQGNPRPDLTGRTCRQSGASVWALEARSPDGRNYPSPAREMVVDQVSQASGGMHELVTTAAQLEGLAGIFANLLASQYAVTFGPGGGTAESQLTVGVRRTDVFVLAPSWRAR